MNFRKSLTLMLGMTVWMAPLAMAADSSVQNSQGANSNATDLNKDQQNEAHFKTQAKTDIKKARHNRKKAAAMEKAGKLDAAVDAEKSAAKEEKNALNEQKKAQKSAQDVEKDMNKASNQQANP